MADVQGMTAASVDNVGPAEARPWTVRTGFWVLVFVAAANLVEAAITFVRILSVGSAEMVGLDGKTMRLSNGHPVPAWLSIDWAAWGLLLVAIVVSVVLTFRWRAGGNAARVALTVFCAFGVLEIGGSALQDIAGAACAFTIVLMYLPPTNRYVRTAVIVRKANATNRDH
jgi:hypothetical protein